MLAGVTLYCTRNQRQLPCRPAYRKGTTAARGIALAGPRCGGCCTRRSGSGQTTSIKCFAVTMRTTALRGTFKPCSGSIGPWSVTNHDAEQPKLKRRDLLEGIPTDQGAVSVAAAKAVSPLPGAASYRYTVKRLLTSVVRENSTPRSVGARGRVTVPGHPVGDRRWSSLWRQLSWARKHFCE